MAGDSSTVRGTFDLATPGRRKLVDLRTEARRTREEFKALGRAMDEVGGARAKQKLQSYEGSLRKVRETTARSTRSMRNDWKETTTQVDRSVRAQIRSLDRLKRKYAELSRMRASAHVEVRGVDEAIIKVELLIRRLKELDRMRSSPRVGLGALAGAGGGSGGSPRQPSSVGGSGGSSGGREVRILGTSVRALAAASLLALPAVQSLTGAVGALAGSLASAVTGAGAVGIAGGGALAVGLGSIASVAVPATKGIKAAATAQASYTKAQQEAQISSLNGMKTADQMRQAEDALSVSQRNALRAQQALTQARRDAKRELVDMSLAAQSAAIGERRATLSLAQAKQHLFEVQTDPRATQLDIRDAQLGVSEASLGSKQARIDARRAKADNKRTQARGVRNNPNVVSAKDALNDANRSVREARRSLQETAASMAQGGSAVAQAKAAMDRAFAKAPKGTRELIASAKEFKKEWRSATLDAQANFVGMLQTALDTASRLKNVVADAATLDTGAAKRESGKFGDFLSGSRNKAFIVDSSQAFDENLGNARRFAEYTISTLENISRAARPFLHEFTTFMAGWSRGWRDSTDDIDHTRLSIRTMVDDAKAWKNLLFAAARLTKDIFSNGRSSGTGLVKSTTAWLNHSDLWIKRNPQKVKAFFANAVSSTEKIAGGVAGIVRGLNSLATLLQPILRNFSDLAAVAGPLMGTPGGIGAAFGVYRGISGMRGRGGGRGGGGGGAGGGGATGSVFTALALGAGRAFPGGAGLSGSSRLTTAFRGGMYGARDASRFAQFGGGLTAAGRAARRMGPGSLLGNTAVGRGLKGGAGALAFTGALSAAGAQGSLRERLQTGLSGLTLGLIPAAVTGAQLADQGTQRADSAISKLPLGGTLAGLQGRLASLRGMANQAQAGSVARGGKKGLFGGYGFLGAFDPGHGGDKGGVSADEAKKNRSAAKEYRAEIERTTTALHDMRTEIHAQARNRSRAAGAHAAANFEQRFTNDRGRGDSVQSAFADTSAATLKKLRSMGPVGGRVLAQNVLSWAEQVKKNNPQITKQVDALTQSVRGRFRDMGRTISVVNGQILTGSTGEWKSISSAISDAAEQGVSKTSAAFAQLRSMAIGSLKAMGFSDAEAKGVLTGAASITRQSGGRVSGSAALDASRGAAASGARYTAQAAASHHHRARGGRAMGKSLTDSVPTRDGGLAGGGELWVNRHTERDADRDLRAAGKPTLDQRVKGETRRHWQPYRRKATGGRESGPNFYGHPSNVGAPIKNLIGFMENRWPQLQVTDTTDHSTLTTNGNVSYHVSGRAVDMAASPDYMKRVSSWINSSGFYKHLTEGIHNPNLSVKNGQQEPRSGAFWGDLTWAQHANHIHMALAGGLGSTAGIASAGGGRGGSSNSGLGNGMSGVTLNAPLSGLGGIPGAMADTASKAYAKALTRKINGASGSTGSGGGGGGGRGITAATGNIMKLAKHAAYLAGVPWDAGIVRTLLSKESGGGKNLPPHQYGGGLDPAGPFQVIGSTFKAYEAPGHTNRMNPYDNALAAFRYIHSRYGTLQHLASATGLEGGGYVGYSRGGRAAEHVGDFRKGTKFTTKPGRPVTFTAGEGTTTEDVHVVPRRGGTGRSKVARGNGDININVTVDMTGAKISSEEDAKRMMERAAEHAAKKLAEALKRDQGDGSRELLGVR